MVCYFNVYTYRDLIALRIYLHTCVERYLKNIFYKKLLMKRYLSSHNNNNKNNNNNNTYYMLDKIKRIE